MEKNFHSNGKLLLTGEYVVLDGALSLALPTKFGQDLKVIEIEKPQIRWKSKDKDGLVWFETVFELSEIHSPSNLVKKPDTRNMLAKILNEASLLNSEFLNGQQGYYIETQLDFPKEWGLGTSSTLINNLAQWAEVDAYKLLWNTFSGSGYDIACAQHSTPLLYKLEDNTPVVKQVSFHPSFEDELFFVYLNKKQNSREAIAHYRRQNIKKGELTAKISEITEAILRCSNQGSFIELMEAHETLLSSILDVKPVKELHFQDYAGAVKSLGAWGGDFILAIGDAETPTYFTSKGYNTIIPYRDMVC